MYTVKANYCLANIDDAHHICMHWENYPNVGEIMETLKRGDRIFVPSPPNAKNGIISTVKICINSKDGRCVNDLFSKEEIRMIKREVILSHRRIVNLTTGKYCLR